MPHQGMHYSGPSTLKSTSSSLANALGNDPIESGPIESGPIEAGPDEAGPPPYTECPSTFCLWFSGGLPCHALIDCGSAPEHFKSHGIKGMTRAEDVPCLWSGCERIIERHNFMRHVREAHLGHKRGVGHVMLDGASTHSHSSLEFQPVQVVAMHLLV
ncbi:hypothetical protein SCLCIDRAFT_29964 [Scleroderma citrinum Foug A]|uniref:Uncharacterized protein n=1 Tax=Scleroderma citrinum Foug A TaxID=1036808 RepID=A0A0C2Z237_9AGAM|nr:hypothetical protein SCLCIDRAFT_29964 [Scleroderma citrinum Foug A]